MCPRRWPRDRFRFLYVCILAVLNAMGRKSVSLQIHMLKPKSNPKVMALGGGAQGKEGGMLEGVRTEPL